MMASLPDRLAEARDFYREQLVRSFAYTGAWSRRTGRTAEDIITTEGFATVLRDCAAGSLDCARRIGEMAVVHLDFPRGGAPGPWWRDVCSYERGYFLQAATTDPGPPTNRPRRGTSALCATFAWDLPKALERLKSGQAVTDELRRDLTLLFARGAEGKVYVVEVGAPVEKVFRATNGLRTLEQISAAADMSVEETKNMLNALAGVGAIALGKSPDEILEIISKRQS
jgi:hypothetical protein